MRKRIPDGLLVKFLRLTAMLGGIFSLLLIVLILVTYLQLKKTDPLNTPALAHLQQQFQRDPANEALKQEIRALDLLARKAYFTSRWQVRTGGYLLAASLLLVIVSVKALELMTPPGPQIPARELPDGIRTLAARRKWLIAGASLLAVIAFVLAWFTHGMLSGTLPSGTIAARDSITADSLRLPAGQLSPVAAADSSGTAGAAVDSTGVADDGGFPSDPELRANFTSFRGPYGLGVAYQKNIPSSWDGPSGKNIRWKSVLPMPGNNSPVVWNNRIYLSGARDDKRAIFCFDASSGKLLWTTEVPPVPGSSGQSPKVIAETGLAAPTLTTDGRRVYAVFANGDLAAADLTGRIVWTHNLGSPKNHYGHSSSLLMYRDRLIVQYDQTGSARVLAFEGKSGRKLWETSREVKISWASPVLAAIDGRTDLVLAAEPFVTGYDPSTGKERWRIDCISGEVGPSPAAANGMVFTLNEYSKLAAIRPGPNPSVAWEDDEYLSDVPSPVAAGDLLFVVTSYGVVICYDATGGKRHWVKELERSVYASPMVADGKLFVLDKQGVMHIFGAGKSMNPLGEAALGEGCVCTPAFADGRIFIRGNSHLYCIGK